VDNHHHVVVGMQINSAIKCHDSLLVSRFTQASVTTGPRRLARGLSGYGGFVLYPNKQNSNMLNAIYSK
ncbi:MAG TPA: hypothetical protein VI457_08860, partial [Methylococcaceae bacterium]|nr:hypothetical protein [Methylococcaceae bacterium]